MKKCTLIFVLAALLYVASWPVSDTLFVTVVITTAVNADGTSTTVELTGRQRWLGTFYRPLHRLAWGPDGAGRIDSSKAGPLGRFYNAMTTLIDNTEGLNRLRLVQIEDQTGGAR